MKLTASNVEAVLRNLLYTEEELEPGQTEPPDDAVLAEGIVHRFAFHPDRLKAETENIKAMLKQLPTTFRKNGGGGWSFLNMCVDADGVQWGEHKEMEALMCLGMAIGRASYVLPREMWPVLPGGVPYVAVEVDD